VARVLDLPHGYQTTIDDDDFAMVKDLTLYRGANGYVYFSQWKDGRRHSQTLHRLLMIAPAKTHIDHINGDKLDNRRSNLRIATPSLNQINRKRLNKNNKSGIRGVGYMPQFCISKPWRAQITVHGKNRHLGLFATKEEAIRARQHAELTYFGELCP